jgi:hypothetical protein
VLKPDPEFLSQHPWAVLAGFAVAAFVIIKAVKGVLKVVLWVVFFAAAVFLAQRFLQ